MSKFTPSAAEVALVNQIFTHTDSQKLGVVTGEAAVKIFNGSKLSPSVLAEVWNLADEDNNGVLTRKGVAIAVRLLGHAQRGERMSDALIYKPGPIPLIEGLNRSIGQQSTGVPLSQSPPPIGGGFPPLTPQDKAKFSRLFSSCGPVNGMLSGDKARDVFVKSKLPVDKLSQIWSLSDTKSRGSLDVSEFIIAMYFIQGAMSGQVQTIPATLPPFLHDQAASKGPVESIRSHATGDSGSFSPTSLSGFPRPVSTLQPQYTGPSLQQQHTGQALRSIPSSPPLPARTGFVNQNVFPLNSQATGTPPTWDVSPTEKQNADRLFDGLDTQNKGYIEGEVAGPFMMQSKLSDDILAQIWDLSDIHNDGRLTRDGFAIAMHLIQGKLAGKEVPASLPPSLFPPSLRTNAGPTQPTQPSIPEAIQDLLWDDTPTPVPPPVTSRSPPPPVQSQGTGFASSNLDPFSNSSFARPAGMLYTLGDDDEPPSTSPPLEDKSAEIGNVQIQVNSTNRSLDTTKAERQNMERVLADQAAQLSALQTQLSSAKAAYETESRLLSALRERFSKQTSEIQKAREDLIRGESDLSAVRVEKAEVEGSVLRDKEEVRELNRKMTEVGTEIAALKLDVEKTKKETGRQKGLLAIAKKQLVTREAERAKVEKELEEARQAAAAAAKEREEAEAELATELPPITQPDIVKAPSPDSITVAAAQPLPASPELGTPGVSTPTTKSTNPFERLAFAASPPQAQSPSLFAFGNSSELPTPAIDFAAPAHDASIDSLDTQHNLDDPFGFSAAFDTDESAATDTAVPQAPETAAEHEADKSSASLSLPTNGYLDVFSPTETEVFLTPPSSATPPKVDELQAAESHFPALDAVTSELYSPTVPGHFPSNDDHDQHTNLDSQLQEIEVEESDSDDDEPLTNVKAKLAEAQSPERANGATGSTNPPKPFDDSFGVTFKLVSGELVHEHADTTTDLPAQAEDLSKSPFSPTGASVSGTASTTVTDIGKEAFSSTNETAPAGVNDFDEALGKLSGSNGAHSQFSQFTFDDAFDDNFDFAAESPSDLNGIPSAPNGAAAPAAPFAPQPAAITPPPTKPDNFDSIFLPSVNGGAPKAPAPAPAASPVVSAAAPAPKPAEEARAFSFDDVFVSTPPTSGPSVPAAQSSTPVAQPMQRNSSLGITFESAFGGNPANALALDNSFSSTIYQPPPGPPPSQSTNTPFPVPSQPSSPLRDTSIPQSDPRRSTSPPLRHTSPPPRQASPKPRPSTASSDKEKPPTRHSKLSIRLPFGRKKAKHEAPPLPPPLTQQQLVEEPTPAAEDDIEAVKQLCGMGFSRTQAVTSLERHGYDVQRALNSLLGTS